jgi:O-methyltransferase
MAQHISSSRRHHAQHAVRDQSGASATEKEAMVTCEPQYLDLLKKCLTGAIYDESAWRILTPPRKKDLLVSKPTRFVRTLLRIWLYAAAERRSVVLVQRRSFDSQVRDVGRDWPFLGYSMIGLRRLDNLQFCIEDVLRSGIPGDLIEAGVWRGGAAIFMRAVLRAHGVTDRVIWVADSFEGLPRPNTELYGTDAGPDLNHVANLKVSMEAVKDNFRRFGLLDDQVQFLKGWFCDTLPNAPIERLAILRLDGDLYESTIDPLRALYHRVSPGGYVIVDDYHLFHSCRKAVTDYLGEHQIEVEIKSIDGDAVYWQVPMVSAPLSASPLLT